MLTEYFPNTKNIKTRIFYESNTCVTLTGFYQEWHENGKLWKEINYKNGELDGLYEEW
jgi:antitoxin component YwqK of YwqJK toxin-antitoxin module